MTKYRTEKVGVNGWTRWIFPDPAGYRMACCDCGLVHELEFAVMPVKYEKNDTFAFSDEDVKSEDRVMFRARLNNRATAQRRRKIKTA